MKLDRNTLLLYGVTDRTWAKSQTLVMQVEEALRGGVTCIQLREKNINREDFLRLAYEIKEICNQYVVPFIINDNVDIALQCAADGIHVGQHDMSSYKVKDMIGENMILGVSVQTVSQALEAERSGADYLGVGAVFATSTKLDADTVSHKVLREICESVSIPVVAIGGINKHNILELSGTNVDGVALVSSIFSVRTIEAECKELLNLSKKMVEGNNERKDKKSSDVK